MRWLWIDRIVEMTPEKRLVAIKNVTLAEEHLHDHFAAAGGLDALPIVPATLLIEGMAQTAGILVGSARGFKEKVILAKISSANFEREVVPGQTVRFEATLDRIDDAGAATSGTLSVADSGGGEWETLGRVDLMFSHIDQNQAGVAFPKENFVFSKNLLTLLMREANLAPKS